MKPRVLGFCQLVTRFLVLVRVLAAWAGLTSDSGTQEGCLKPLWVLRVTSCLRSAPEGISCLWCGSHGCGHQSPLPGAQGKVSPEECFITSCFTRCGLQAAPQPAERSGPGVFNVDLQGLPQENIASGCRDQGSLLETTPSCWMRARVLPTQGERHGSRRNRACPEAPGIPKAPQTLHIFNLEPLSSLLN